MSENNDYTKALVLLYFREKGQSYHWQELRELLGLTSTQLDRLICDFVEKGYLEYDNYELRLGEKGYLFLISTNQLLVLH